MNAIEDHRSKLLALVGIVIAVPIIAVLALLGFVGWGLTTGHIADTKVVAGNKLPPRVVKSVSAAAGLEPGERILYFYSSAITPTGDGNLLTDQRVISYVDDGTEAWRESIAIEDVVSVEFKQSVSWLEDSTIVVTSSDGTELTLYACNEGGGDARFVEAIRAAAKQEVKAP